MIVDEKHEKEKARKRKYNEYYKTAHPYVRQMKTISSMKYIAKLRKDTKRVEELEKRYDELRRLRNEWRRAQQNEDKSERNKQSSHSSTERAQKSSTNN